MNSIEYTREPEPVLSVIEEHLASLRESGDYSKATIALAVPWLLHFQKFCGGRDPAELKPKDLEQWHKHLAWNPGPSGKLYSEATVNTAVGAVRRFYRWGLAAGKFQTNPAETLVTPKAKRISSQKLTLEPRQLRKVFSLLEPDTPSSIRDRAVLGVLVETGISRSACSRIDRAHLCFDTGALLTRGRTQQIHSLTDGLLSDLHRYLRDARPLLVTDITPALFLNRSGNRLSAPSIQQLAKKARKLAAL
ncbi:MAG: phage integrase N-terminal SAM-like domain-containing protein [Vulcanimicrobiota bacterium]